MCGEIIQERGLQVEEYKLVVQHLKYDEETVPSYTSLSLTSPLAMPILGSA